MKKKLQLYLLYILASIFFFLITEIQLIDIISKFSLKTELISFFVVNFIVLLFWSLSLFYFFKLTFAIHQEKMARQSDLMQLDESQKLLRALQSQRHDFRNQLQVIKMLTQINKTEEAINYIEDCVFMSTNSEVVPEQINNAALSAMLLVYAAEAKDKGIHLAVDSDIDFSGFSYSPVKITRLLGNIIRNALEILEHSTSTDRSITITMWENPEQYNFAIWNNGPAIPQEIQSQIFSPGFSTKHSSGLGLAIVSSLLNEFDGKILLTSSDSAGTEFRVILPRLLTA